MESPNRLLPRFLTSGPSSGRLPSPLKEDIKAFCGGSKGQLGIKLLSGVKRTGRFFEFTGEGFLELGPRDE